MAIGTMVAFADPLRARTNIQAWNLINQVNALNREIALRQLRLATGRQQPRMEDGASFFAIWNKMKNQVRGKTMALDNIGDAKDELSLAEAGMLQIDEMLGRMRDLVVRAGNDTLTDEQREDIRQELLNLYMTIGNIVKRTRFNEGGAGGDGLLDGFSHVYQVGPNETAMDIFEVAIPNILLAVTKTLSPELGGKVEALVNTIANMADPVREKLAAEIDNAAVTMPKGIRRKAIEGLAEAFRPGGQPSDFLIAISKMTPEEAAQLDQDLTALFNERLSSRVENPPFVDLVRDGEVKQQFNGLAPAIGDIFGQFPAVETLADGLKALADSGQIEDPELVQQLKNLGNTVQGINDNFTAALDGLESLINGSVGSETQRFFVAQDIAFYTANAPQLANQPNVQNALMQLASDIFTGQQGLTNFVDAVSALSADERGLLKNALEQVASDPVNGLSFHVAQPDLDGPNAPFSPGNNSFAQAVINISEKPPEPLDTDTHLSAILQNVANAVAGQLPNVADRLNAVIALLSDNDDSNDAALVSELQSLGAQLEIDTRDDLNLAGLFQRVADTLRGRFPDIAGRLDDVANLMLNATDPNALIQALVDLGKEIEDSTGTGATFTNPIDRSAVQVAFISAANSPQFQNLSPALRNAYVNMVNALVNTVDLDASGAPFALEVGSFIHAVLSIDPTSQENLAMRAPLRDAILAQVNSEDFQALSPFMQQTLLNLADAVVTTQGLAAPGGPFSLDTPNSFTRALAEVIETDLSAPPQEDPDDMNLAAVLQTVAGNISANFPSVAAALNSVITLLTDNDDTNDVALADALNALGTQIEQVTGGESNINGPARAELRRAFLEAASSPTFQSLAIPLQVAYLTMAEALGAFAPEQVDQLDAQLEALGAAVDPDTSGLAGQLDALADAVAKQELSGSDRNAVIKGLSTIADALGNIAPDNQKVQALRNLIDDPGNEGEPNPTDLVGTLSRYVTDEQDQALQALFAGSVGESDLGEAVQNFLQLQSNEDATRLLSGVDEAINAVKDQLINLGGIQTKLTSLENILSTSIETEDSVASRFGDADLAKEQVELAKLNLFSQLASAQAAAANILPAQVIGALISGR